MTSDFLTRYCDYANDQTDAPLIYHHALSYFIVSSVIGKNVYLPFGFKNLYPNLFLLIGAPSSLHRKSWSQKMAVDLISQLNQTLVMPEVSSREAFLAELANPERIPQGTGIIAIDELGGFMKRVKHSPHFEGFIQDLSTLYDGHRIFRRSGTDEDKKKIIDISDPFVNLTAACSLDWLDESAQTSDITGGFLSRFLWVIIDNKVQNPRSEPGQADLAKKEELIQKLQRISSFIGKAQLDPSAQTAWNQWYSTFRTENQGGRWDANFERLTVIAKKIAILNAVMRIEAIMEIIPKNEITVAEGDIWKAATFVEDSIQNFSKVTIGANKMDVYAQRVAKFVTRNGQVSRSQVLNGVYGINAWTLDQIVKTLEQSEIIKSEEISKDINGTKKVVFYSKFEQ